MLSQLVKASDKRVVKMEKILLFVFVTIMVSSAATAPVTTTPTQLPLSFDAAKSDESRITIADVTKAELRPAFDDIALQPASRRPAEVLVSQVALLNNWI